MYSYIKPLICKYLYGFKKLIIVILSKQLQLRVTILSTYNFHVVVYQVFLSNINNLHTVIWYEVFLSIQIICTQFNGIKYSYLIQIIWIQLYDINYSHGIHIICIQLYGIKYSYIIQIICTKLHGFKYSNLIYTQLHDFNWPFLFNGNPLYRCNWLTILILSKKSIVSSNNSWYKRIYLYGITYPNLILIIF